MNENESSTTEKNNENSNPEFEKVLIGNIPTNEDFGEIELEVRLNYGERKGTKKTYKITY